MADRERHLAVCQPVVGRVRAQQGTASGRGSNCRCCNSSKQQHIGRPWPTAPEERSYAATLIPDLQLEQQSTHPSVLPGEGSALKLAPKSVDRKWERPCGRRHIGVNRDDVSTTLGVAKQSVIFHRPVPLRVQFHVQAAAHLALEQDAAMASPAAAIATQQ